MADASASDVAAGAGKLRGDLIWTGGSFVILAASGILINLFVALGRDAAALGVFNQSYAIYIIVSQIAAFGVHYSVTRRAALADADPGPMLWSALGVTLLTGTVVALAVYNAAPHLGAAFGSDRTGLAIAYAALGIALFPANKVLIGYLNGLREMKAFAVFQSLRYILVAAVVATVAWSSAPFELALLAFLVAETATFLGALAYILARRLGGSFAPSRRDALDHARFGGKALFGGIFLEVNTRVDVICIGLFLDDAAVGIYSFAAMLVDGVYHLLALVRVNFNPIIVRVVRDRDGAAARRLVVRTRRLIVPATAVLEALIVAFYLGGIALLLPGSGLEDGLQALLILLIGMLAISPFVPFDNLLVSSGFPAYQTAQQFCGLVTNVVLNVALIPIIGIEGAALGTAASYIAATIFLVIAGRRLVGWDILRAVLAPRD